MSEVDQPIRVVFGADEAYALPAAVSIRSLLENYKSTKPLEIYVVDGGMSSESRRKLIDSCEGLPRMLAPRASLEMPENELGFPVAVGLRLEMPFLLPDHDKAIYLDSDILVFDCISKLWDMPIPEEAPLAAVLSLVTPRGHRGLTKLGFSPTSLNFNSGVLVMNLKLLRATIGRAYEIFKSEKLLLPDQDALNLVYDKQWYQLPPRWNFQQHFTFGMLGHESAPWRLGGFFSEADAADMFERPAIVHFANIIKPWHRDAANVPHADLWRKYALSGTWHRDAVDAYVQQSTLDRVAAGVTKELSAIMTGCAPKAVRELIEQLRVPAS